MHLGQLKPLFNHYLLFAPHVGMARPEQRTRYQIILLCGHERAACMEHLVGRYLSGMESGLQVVSRETQLHDKFTRIVVHLSCTVPERADLVRLVSRLGLEQSVRSVRWESVPTRLNA